MNFVLAASNTKALWYLTRGTGVVSLILLTTVLVLGVLGVTRWRSERWPRFLVAGLHRNLTLFAIAFVVVHVVTTVADGFAPIRLVDAVVPFVSAYRPVWLGLGALAFDLLLALTLTSLLRARVGLRLWRAVHWLAYAAWPLALVHGLGTGSDSRLGWLQILTLCCAAAVVAAVAVRLLRANARPRLRIAAGVATVAVAALVLGWYRSGPAQSGWAARAGTPTSNLRTVSASPVAVRTATMPSSFDGKLTGRLARNADGAGNVGIAIGGNVTGGAVEGVLKLTLWGADSNGGVAMTDSKVTFQPLGIAGSYTGQVVGLDGNLVQADVTNSSGDTVRLTISLQIDSATGAVTGTVHGA
ncbi:MAG: ferric reductase-like transmembrane domain-containing protein [Gaiellaceae bacterium]